MIFQNNNSNIERRSHNVVKRGKLCENMKNLQRKNEKEEEVSLMIIDVKSTITFFKNID